MIFDVEIKGRQGTGIYLDDKLNPVPVNEATMLKVCFNDGERVFCRVEQPAKSIAGDTKDDEK